MKFQTSQKYITTKRTGHTTTKIRTSNKKYLDVKKKSGHTTKNPDVKQEKFRC